MNIWGKWCLLAEFVRRHVAGYSGLLCDHGKEPSGSIKGSEFVEYISFSRRTLLLGVCCLYGMNEFSSVVLWRELMIRQTSFSLRIPRIFLDLRKAHNTEHGSASNFSFMLLESTRIFNFSVSVSLRSIYLSLLIKLTKVWRVTCKNVCQEDS
jgi:hypothetical protein